MVRQALDAAQVAAAGDGHAQIDDGPGFFPRPAKPASWEAVGFPRPPRSVVRGAQGGHGRSGGIGISDDAEGKKRSPPKLATATQ